MRHDWNVSICLLVNLHEINGLSGIIVISILVNKYLLIVGHCIRFCRWEDKTVSNIYRCLTRARNYSSCYNNLESTTTITMDQMLFLEYLLIVLVKAYQNLTKELWILKFNWSSLVVLEGMVRRWGKGCRMLCLCLLLKKERPLHFWNLDFASTLYLWLYQSFLITNSVLFSFWEQCLSKCNVHKNR